MKGTFLYDYELLKKHTHPHLLKDGDAYVLVVPEYQGRVMTSSSQGMQGCSYGWINHALIASGEKQPQIHVYGGEDRFWMGPEGGQYAIFFKTGDSFDFANWKTPAIIDTEKFHVLAKNDKTITFVKNAELTNYAGTHFIIKIIRSVSILPRYEIEQLLHCPIDTSIRCVGYQSINNILNNGNNDWKKEQGLLSIWILGMFHPSDNTVIILPIKGGKNAASHVRDNYFGKVPADRLCIADSTVFFKGDGKMRGKIGIPPGIVKPVAGSYDSKKHLLTIIQFDFANDSEYVNSLWEIQDDPYNGDVVNAYNDGPLADGTCLGPFYELESSSPAKDLKQGETLTHTHKTFHFQGQEEKLNNIARKVLKTDLAKIRELAWE